MINTNETTFFALRERTSFQACDAALLIWRKNIVSLLLVFVIPITILVAIGILVPVLIHLAVFIGVIWWLKPLFERFALHIIQIRFFNTNAKGKALRKNFLKHTLKGLCGDLLWRRFTPYRSVIMPLRILENLKGKKLSERKLILTRGGIQFGIFLTIFCISLELLLYASEALFFTIFNQLVDMSFLYQTNGKISFYIIYIPYLINYIVMETIYVCAGFSVYINSRIIVEGWDLQLMLNTAAGKK
ncbi:MAG: hypothetical protein Ta2F_07860 [Termitinemataceae bacterium]|nr:MAG: hypothetical protein Ta2F_07860 [Termitinemataceae bacterium]